MITHIQIAIFIACILCMALAWFQSNYATSQDERILPIVEIAFFVVVMIVNALVYLIRRAL